jgi:hypothetical protein
VELGRSVNQLFQWFCISFSDAAAATPKHAASEEQIFFDGKRCFTAALT